MEKNEGRHSPSETQKQHQLYTTSTMSICCQVDHDIINQEQENCRPAAIIKKIPVVVVESHQHVLEHFHHVLRRGGGTTTNTTKYNKQERHRQRRRSLLQRCLAEKWRLVHFDAHPDLACPGPHIPAKACFQPRKTWPRKKKINSNIKDKSPVPKEVAKEKMTTEESETCSSVETPFLVATEGQQQDDSDDEKDLYELLDSTPSGIAEWILPLVLATELQEVQWIRPSWMSSSSVLSQTRQKQQWSTLQTQQLPDGKHHYHVGAWIPPRRQQLSPSITPLGVSTNPTADPAGRDGGNDDSLLSSPPSSFSNTVTSFLDLPDQALVKVDWDFPYYRDDDEQDSYAPLSELLLAKPLLLQVLELPVVAVSAADQQQPQQQQRTGTACDRPCPFSSTLHCRKPWALDICLDYFVCLNPFVVDVEKASPVFARKLVEAMLASVFYKKNNNDNSDNDISNDDDDYARATTHSLAKFRRLIVEFLQAFVAVDTNKLDNTTKTDIASSSAAAENDNRNISAITANTQQEHILSALLVYYTSPKTGIEVLRALQGAFWQENSNHRNNVKSDATTAVADQQQSVIRLAVEAVPTMSMPHQFGCLDDNDRFCSALDEQRILSSIKQSLQASKEYNDQQQNNPPWIISIARSMNDGFTPTHVADRLQDQVLLAVHDVFCGCNRLAKYRTSIVDGTAPSSPVLTPERFSSCACSSKLCHLEFLFDYGKWEGSSF